MVSWFFYISILFHSDKMKGIDELDKNNIIKKAVTKFNNTNPVKTLKKASK